MSLRKGHWGFRSGFTDLMRLSTHLFHRYIDLGLGCWACTQWWVVKWMKFSCPTRSSTPSCWSGCERYHVWASPSGCCVHYSQPFLHALNFPEVAFLIPTPPCFMLTQVLSFIDGLSYISTSPFISNNLNPINNNYQYIPHMHHSKSYLQKIMEKLWNNKKYTEKFIFLKNPS